MGSAASPATCLARVRVPAHRGGDHRHRCSRRVQVCAFLRGQVAPAPQSGCRASNRVQHRGLACRRNRLRDNKSHGLLLSEEPAPRQRRCRSVELAPCRNSVEATGVLTPRPGSGYEGVRSQKADAAPGPVRNEMKVLHGYGLSLILTAFLTSSQTGRTRASTRTRGGRRVDNCPGRAPLSSELRHCMTCPDTIEKPLGIDP